MKSRKEYIIGLAILAAVLLIEIGCLVICPDEITIGATILSTGCIAYTWLNFRRDHYQLPTDILARIAPTKLANPIQITIGYFDPVLDIFGEVARDDIEIDHYPGVFHGQKHEARVSEDLEIKIYDGDIVVAVFYYNSPKTKNK